GGGDDTVDGGRAAARRHPGERRPARHDRHPGEPGCHAQGRLLTMDTAGRDRRDHRLAGVAREHLRDRGPDPGLIAVAPNRCGGAPIMRRMPHRARFVAIAFVTLAAACGSSGSSGGTGSGGTSATGGGSGGTAGSSSCSVAPGSLIGTFKDPVTSTNISPPDPPGIAFKDTDGKLVNAHGGGIIKVCDTYYLHGEYFLSTTTDNNFNGFSMYSSKDFATWKNEGMILPQQASGLLGPNRKGERPHIIRCPATGEFVLYAHAADTT